jgi:hypothetical protein
MQKRWFLSLLLPLLVLFALAPSALADGVSLSSEHGEWVAVNTSKTKTVTVTYEFTDVTLDRAQRVTRVIPPQGKVRICPVAGNTAPKSVQER